MSTLAAARADNMYYPPEWRPEMGGISKFQGSNGHNQYEKYGKIRFELPVHGWCLGCGRHIGRGTRFNATKDQAGTYYSTKIWQFSMKCPSCSTVLVIQTDPKNTDYEYVSGIRKKDMAFDPEEAQTQRVQDKEVSNQLAVDPLYRLEHEQADKRRAASRKTVLTQLTELADSHAQDDYSSNARLRKTMRSRKKEEREREEEATARGLGIRLATPIPADAEAARRIKYRSRHKGFKTGEKAKMAAITGESIFGSGKESSAQARQKAVLVKAAKLGIRTKGMRLLKPDAADTMRRPGAASRSNGSASQIHGSVSRSSGSVSRGDGSASRAAGAAPHPSAMSEPPRKETRKRRRHHAESETIGVHDDEDRWCGDGTQLDVGGPVDGEGVGVASVPVRLREEDTGGRTAVVASKKRRKKGRVGNESASVASVPVRLGEGENGGEAVAASKKRRRKSSLSQPTPASAASSSSDGLAAIAGSY